MILPPFFGYPIPSRDREIYRLKYSYLGEDIFSYTIPTKSTTVTFIGTDILTYQTVKPEMFHTYLAQDILTYTTPKEKLTNSLLCVDILTYYPPPAPPEPPTNLAGLGDDGTATLSWTAPYANRSPLIDYIVEYSTGTFTSWNIYNDGISLDTSVFVTGLENLTNYKFRVSASNAVGTGNFSNYVTIMPSALLLNYCDMSLYLPFDGDYVDYSCNNINMQAMVPTGGSLSITSGDYKYGGYSLYTDGIEYGEPFNNDNPPEYAHIIVGAYENINWTPSGDFTIEMFVKGSSNNISGTIFSIKNKEGYFTDNNSYVQLRKYNNTLYFNFYTDYYNSGSQTYIYEDSSITATNIVLTTGWKHIAVSRADNTMRLFVDGINKGTKVTSFNPKLDNHDFYIASDIKPPHYDAGTSLDGFAGYIDQFIYTKMAKYKGRFVPSEYSLPYNCDDCEPYIQSQTIHFVP